MTAIPSDPSRLSSHPTPSYFLSFNPRSRGRHLYPPPRLQFLALLKLMDYSLLVGIHDVERAEQDEVESEDNEGEDEGESDGGVGTPPDSPSNTLDSTKPLSPGEFDPTIDVYAIKSNDGESPLLCRVLE